MADTTERKLEELTPITEGEISRASFDAANIIALILTCFPVVKTPSFEEVYDRLEDHSKQQKVSKKVQKKAVEILNMGKILFGEQVFSRYESNGKIWNWFHIAYQLEVNRTIAKIRDKLEARLK